MKTEKLSLKSIKNVLSRNELKKIMAGSAPYCTPQYGGVCGYGVPAPPPCRPGLICYVTQNGNYFLGSCIPG